MFIFESAAKVTSFKKEEKESGKTGKLCRKLLPVGFSIKNVLHRPEFGSDDLPAIRVFTEEENDLLPVLL